MIYLELGISAREIVETGDQGRQRQRRVGVNIGKRSDFPKTMYHPTNPVVIVYNAQQQAKLGAEYSERYIYQAYPTCRYHWTKPDQLVNNAEEEAALGGGWANTPAAFDPYRDLARARPQQPDPIKWLDAWSVPSLSPDHRKRIKAQLFEADAAFWKSPDDQSASVNTMRLAFDGIAKVLLDEGILTEQLLENDIPVLVWESAIAGGWYTFASETPKSIFPERIGHYWVWRDENHDSKRLFRSETSSFLASLLHGSGEKNRDKGAAASNRRSCRRNKQYQAIDKALREVAAAQPNSHEEVFRMLDDRKIALPNRKTFKSAGGWLKGFYQNRHSASAWLSQNWARLGLRAFPRGPKK